MVKQISTLEKLVEHAVAVAQKKATWEEVDILPGAAAIPIRVAGSGWGKYIDARGATFVRSLQEKLNEIFSSYPGQLPASAPLIKVEIRKGSNELLPYLEPLIKIVVDKVSPEQVVEIIKYAVLCVCGVWALGKITSLIDSIDDRHVKQKADQALLSATTEQQRQALRTIEKSVDTIRQIVLDNEEAEQKCATPLRTYVSSLDKNDTVSIAATPPVKAAIMKHYLRRRRSRSTMRYVVCDCTIDVLGLNFEQPKPRLSIRQDNKLYLAVIERLSPDERKFLVSRVETRLTSEEAIQIALRINAYFTDAGINRIVIIGIGSPRTGVIINRLNAIPNDVKDVYDDLHRPTQNTPVNINKNDNH